LGRDLAPKILLDRHCDRTDLVDRFVDEAQIWGLLQYPGVVPVYELGTVGDRRPFFTTSVGSCIRAGPLGERQGAHSGMIIDVN
jgi:hypothetical protein